MRSVPRRLAAGAALVLASSLVAYLVGADAPRSTAGRCDQPDEAVMRVPVAGRVYGVRLLADGGYAVDGTSGSTRLDPCSLAPDGSAGDAPASRPAAGAAVVSLPTPSADAPLRADGARVWIADGVAWLAPDGRGPRRLLVPGDALGAAIDDSGRRLAVTDREGTLSLFELPAGVAVARVPAHSRNAYAVLFDEPRRRIVSVAGPGELTVTRWPDRWSK